jgi:hypothetical protein
MSVGVGLKEKLPWVLATVEEPINRRTAKAWLIITLVAAGIGVAVYSLEATWRGQVEVQLDGAEQDWAPVVAAVPDVRWDFVLVAGYGIALLFAGCLARALFRTV